MSSSSTSPLWPCFSPASNSDIILVIWKPVRGCWLCFTGYSPVKTESRSPTRSVFIRVFHLLHNMRKKGKWVGERRSLNVQSLRDLNLTPPLAKWPKGHYSWLELFQQKAAPETAPCLPLKIGELIWKYITLNIQPYVPVLYTSTCILTWIIYTNRSLHIPELLQFELRAVSAS